MRRESPTAYGAGFVHTEFRKKSDGDPPFNSDDYERFTDNWGVRRRLSSAYFPQSNGRSEAAVKTAKRFMTNNVDRFGTLNTDGIAQAMLLHRNTPVQDVGISPAVMLFGHPIRDHLPNLLAHETIRSEWSEIRNLREKAMSKRHLRESEHLNVATKELKPLATGDHVIVQNQTGPQPLRWHKAGRIVEDRGNRQYTIKIDGSGRTTLRNRRFLRQTNPICATPQCITMLPALMKLIPPSKQVQTSTHNPRNHQ